MALDNNLTLRSAGFGVEQARENIQLQKAGHYPSLDLNANRADVDTAFTRTISSQVNLQLTIPLYSGGAVSSRSRQAAYNYEASRQNLENLQRDAVRTVRNAYRGQKPPSARSRHWIRLGCPPVVRWKPPRPVTRSVPAPSWMC